MSVERKRELRRRRSRHKKMQILKRKLRTASVSEKLAIAGKIRQLTPGGEQVVATLSLEER